MRLAENVLLLGNGHFNIYAVGSGPVAVLEGGISALVPVVAKQVKHASWPSQVEHLVIMHAHYDHVCGLPGLQKLFPKARLAGSKEAARVLQNPKIMANFYREDAASTGFMQGQSLNDTLISPEAPPVKTFTVERIIQDQDRWDLGPGVTLHFYSAPGHSPCSILAYLPASEVLFSSDAAGFPINDHSLFPIFFAGYNDYLKTIQHMRELPVQVLAGGHEQIIQGSKAVRRFLDLARLEAERLLETVLNARSRGLDVDAIANMLFEQYYHGDLLIYSEQNIRLCCQILTRRSLEAVDGEMENQQ